MTKEEYQAHWNALADASKKAHADRFLAELKKRRHEVEFIEAVNWLRFNRVEDDE